MGCSSLALFYCWYIIIVLVVSHVLCWIICSTNYVIHYLTSNHDALCNFLTSVMFQEASSVALTSDAWWAVIVTAGLNDMADVLIVVYHSSTTAHTTSVYLWLLIYTSILSILIYTIRRILTDQGLHLCWLKYSLWNVFT